MDCHLSELARQVRGHTIKLLESTPTDWLTWAPRGTSNHITWHAGHALWVCDALGVRRLMGKSELPPNWEEKFGMNCRPVAEQNEWPNGDELTGLLRSQLDRLLVLLDEHRDRLSTIGPNTPSGWDLTRGLIHALHDEARHHGEMYLLLKLRRAGEEKDEG